MYELLKKDGRAKRGRFTTVHGVIETPVFMNVGTAAAIKGAVSTDDLRGIKTQVELSNTYHLHVRPGDEVVKKLGGLHKFMNWDKPILTDSGGFQVFSLTALQPARRTLYRIRHILSVCHTGRALIKCHRNRGCKIRLNLHALFRSHKYLMTINM